MAILVTFLLLHVLGAVTFADDTRLIRAGSVWKYFKGTVEPVLPVGDWRLEAFNDQTWPSSMSGFSTSAYAPEPGYLTDYGFGYRTLYVRKKFNVNDPASIAQLIFRVEYDDGFVAYLNGREVARRGAAGVIDEPLPVDSSAPFHPRGISEEIDLSAALPLLRVGENLLAVQVLGSGLTDYTVAFVPELLGNFTRGPYVQNTTSNSTQIVFKTLNPTPAFLDLQTEGGAFDRMILSPAETNHVATLTNLLVDTAYTYRVGANISGKEVTTDWHTFRTFKTSGRISFAALGDSGWGSREQHLVAEQMRLAQPDFIMHLGDMVYGTYTHSSEDFRCLSVYADQLYTTPMFLALGNHDSYASATAALETFYLPTNNVTGSERFYSFDHGDVHFVVVWTDLQQFAEYAPGSVQYTWLDQDLAQTTKPWKFIFFHHVWRSSGPHNNDDYDFNTVYDRVQLEAGPLALARKHGVQIIFNGHDHDYERFAPNSGMMSFVSGGGGAIIYAPSVNHPESSQYFLRHHFLKVTVDAEEALVEAVGANGTAFDRVHLRRELPERETFQSRWDTPVVSAPPSNGDGNALGQVFDFTGESVGGKVGQFSSAGRLFVNNDNFHVYLGFDEVMLRAADELFVFVESEQLPGVERMSDVAGTNSLSTLASLVFTNFSPAIGIVLGDEYGDGGFVNFVRFGSTNNTGQGAFYLTNGLPLVPGQRISQFNRSPEEGPLFYEQNANFVQIALPYSVLKTQPGEKLKIAAIVGLRPDSTNAINSARALDAPLGYSFATATNLSYLEPVEVQLEADLDADDDDLTEAQETSIGTDPRRADSDADSLPDGWEVAFGFQPLVNDSTGDADGDGMSNVSELYAGTHPRDPNSRLTATATARSGKIDLRWSAVPGRTYTVQARSDLLGPSQDVPAPSLPRVAKDVFETLSLDISPDARAQYYRVVVLPP